MPIAFALDNEGHIYLSSGRIEHDNLKPPQIRVFSAMTGKPDPVFDPIVLPTPPPQFFPSQTSPPKRVHGCPEPWERGYTLYLGTLLQDPSVAYAVQMPVNCSGTLEGGDYDGDMILWTTWHTQNPCRTRTQVVDLPCPNTWAINSTMNLTYNGEEGDLQSPEYRTHALWGLLWRNDMAARKEKGWWLLGNGAWEGGTRKVSGERLWPGVQKGDIMGILAMDDAVWLLNISNSNSILPEPRSSWLVVCWDEEYKY